MKKIYFHKHLMPLVENGTKTMTRRIIPKSIVDEYSDYLTTCMLAGVKPTKVIEKSRYKVGEVVAIAQPYKDIFPPETGTSTFDECFFEHMPGWNNKLYVRADLMPSRIQFTDVKVERLKDISDEDCIKEGVYTQDVWCDIDYCFENICFENAQEAFRYILSECCKPKTLWDDNPWVFAYTYTKDILPFRIETYEYREN